MVRAFLIGAGATRAQYPEAPLSADFFDWLAKRNSQLYSDIEKTIEPHIKGTLKDSNIEEIMNLSLNFPQSINTSFYESLYRAIYELLVEPTESDAHHIDKYMRGDTGKGPTTFKILLNDPRLSEDDFFMTLNYDLYLDREILSIQRDIDYGIGKEIFNRNVEIQLSTKPNFSVYHLHGSLNWEMLPNNKVNIHKGPLQPHHTRIGSNVCLAPPGIKDLNPVLKSIWLIAEKRLLNADELIIIGCSLNQDDTDLINLIKKFKNEKCSEKIKIIYLASSTDDMIEYNYQATNYLYSTEEIYSQVVGQGFKGFPYGFYIHGIKKPSGIPGAIEFIFE